MCEPVSIIAGVASTAGGLMQGRAARAQARSQAGYQAQQEAINHYNYEQQVDYQHRLMEFQSDQYARFAASQADSLSGQFGAVLENIDQAKMRTLQSIQQRAQKAASSMAFTNAAAAESGVQGKSIQAAMNTYQAAEAQATEVEVANLKGYVRQQQRNATAYRAAAQNALNRALPAPMAPINLPGPQSPVSQPGMMPYALSGISSGISAGVSTYDVMRTL
tara:strand:- start:2505 stop:3164 length:660 start_codon:yes stop_codon:yes gene_type:complete